MTTHTEVVNLLSDRASLYRFLSILYYKPLEDVQIEALAESSLCQPTHDDSSPFANAYHNIYGSLRLRHTGTREMLAADFTGAFYGIRTIQGRTAQPYQPLYQEEGGLLMGEARAQVYHKLKASALKVADGIDLPEDHFSFICSYMTYLCEKTIEALSEEDIELALDLTNQQRTFFENHIHCWVPSFIEQAFAFVETRFYRGVLELTSTFIDQEEYLLNEIQALLEKTAA